MDLRPLFSLNDTAYDDRPAGAAVLQRWAYDIGDFSRLDRHDPTLEAEIKRRPPVRIMAMADYVHEGTSAVFLLDVETLPCGKLQFAAVGITRTNPHLHALSSMAYPRTPLVMPAAAWRALLTRQQHTTTVTTWLCGDHGSQTRTDLVVSAANGAIRVKRREYSCPAQGGTGALLRQTDD